ncbi:hypothetical protein EV182_004557, partial [Spiromyces aspiralis]
AKHTTHVCKKPVAPKDGSDVPKVARKESHASSSAKCAKAKLTSECTHKTGGSSSNDKKIGVKDSQPAASKPVNKDPADEAGDDDKDEQPNGGIFQDTINVLQDKMADAIISDICIKVADEINTYLQSKL